MSQSPVGIDIEEIDRKTRNLIPRIATEKEAENLKNSSLSPSVLLWCVKEAIVKAYGIGHRFSFRRYEVEISQKLPWKVTKDPKIKTPFKIKHPYVNFVLKGNYLVAICGEKSEIDAHPHLFNSNTKINRSHFQ